MKKKTKIALVFGGKSDEHDISVKSAKAIFSHLNRKKFTPEMIYINREGYWTVVPGEDDFNWNLSDLNNFQSFVPWQISQVFKKEYDIVFPVLHGPNGEDGKIQGIFEMAGIPFVGANSLSSALAMDKGISKILFRREGMNTAEFLIFTENEKENIVEEINDKIGYPCYIKPCSLGSSVGITRAENRSECIEGIDLAFKFDKKIIVEEEIRGKEYEVSVMGNRKIRVSRPGSFTPSRDFYDFEDKYILGKTKFHIPAKLDSDMEIKLRKEAEKAYKALFLNGFSRVDLFIEEGTGKIFVNEINTIPGFTEISMFPKLWETEGLNFSQLIDILVDYGFQYHAEFNGNR